MRDERDYARHVDYVHFNPVKHGLVSEVTAWPYSSFHRAVERGEYPASWGGPDDQMGAWGEREAAGTGAGVASDWGGE